VSSLYRSFYATVKKNSAYIMGAMANQDD